MKRLKKALREPSTYAGLGILGALFGIKELSAFTAPDFATVVAGIAAVLLPEAQD